MVNRVINFCQNVSIELNLFELIKDCAILVLVIVNVLAVKKILSFIIDERKIDKSLRETRARISQIVSEIEENSNAISERDDLRTDNTVTSSKISTELVDENLTIEDCNDCTDTIENAKQRSEEPEVTCNQKVSEGMPKGKKTRAMSMEERWAEFDRKRSMRSTA